MKKITGAFVAVSLVAASLTGCTQGNNTPGSTLVGAAAGGLIASQIFRGPGDVAGIIAGSLLGGSVGYIIGRHMDRQDQINMQNAVATTPVGQQATWVNPNTNATYVVRPTRVYTVDGNPCREYTTRVNIGGTWRTAYGHACRNADGSWQIVN